MTDSFQVRVLFVCMGNICRSPTAHGVFRQLVAEAGRARLIDIDSAGTHAYHLGEPPDRRAQEAARARGIEIADLRARRATAEDFAAFDYVLAMDRDNYEYLAQRCPPEKAPRLRLFMEFAAGLGVTEVPDPYYGGQRGFEQVLDLIEVAARGLLTEIEACDLAADPGAGSSAS